MIHNKAAVILSPSHVPCGDCCAVILSGAALKAGSAKDLVFWILRLRLRMTTFFLGALIVLICANSAVGFAEDTEKTEEDLVARIGSQRIYLNEVRNTAAAFGPSFEKKFDFDLVWRKEFIQNYVTETALARRAKREKIDKEPKIAVKLEKARRTVLSDELLDRRLRDLYVTDEALRERYEKNKNRYLINKEKLKKGEEPVFRPFEEARGELEAEYAKQAQDQAVQDLIRETFEQEEVRLYSE